MKSFLPLTAILLLIGLSHFAGIFSFSILNGFKTGNYVVPITGWKANGWFSFMLWSLLIIQVFFTIGGLMTYVGHKISIDYFGSAYPSVILNMVSFIVWTVFLMRYRVGEMPSKAGWAALVLVLIAGLLAAYAGNQVVPKQ